MKRNRIKKMYEFSDEFLDFNEFGPAVDQDHENEKDNYTLDEFLDLPHFESFDACEKALQALKNNELHTIKVNDLSDIIMKPELNLIDVIYGTINLKFNRKDLIASLKEKCDQVLTESFNKIVNESVEDDEEDEEEMMSVKKFKEFITIEDNKAEYEGKDKF